MALAADRILSAPQAPISLLGVGSQTLYYAPLLERIGLRAEVHARGEYKTAAEPSLRDSMSEPQREQLTALIAAVQAELEARGRERGRASIAARARALFEQRRVGRARRARGRADRRLLLRRRAAARARHRAARQARPAAAGRALRGVAAGAALAARAPAAGDRGGLGARRDHAGGTARCPDRAWPCSAPIVGALRAARRNPRVRAVLLYVDSPGGSALASDLIHREIVRLREKKPVVAYFGDVAASGGYYVAAPCQRIVAQPTTITGSIGVISLRVLAGELAERVGLRPQTLRAAPHADMLSPFRALDAREQAMFAGRDRVDLPGVRRRGRERSRQRSAEEIERVARGRVWSGADALRLGLGRRARRLRSRARARCAQLAPELRGLPEDQIDAARCVSAREPEPAAARPSRRRPRAGPGSGCCGACPPSSGMRCRCSAATSTRFCTPSSPNSS